MKKLFSLLPKSKGEKVAIFELPKFDRYLSELYYEHFATVDAEISWELYIDDIMVCSDIIKKRTNRIKLGRGRFPMTLRDSVVELRIYSNQQFTIVEGHLYGIYSDCSKTKKHFKLANDNVLRFEKGQVIGLPNNSMVRIYPDPWGRFVLPRGRIDNINIPNDSLSILRIGDIGILGGYLYDKDGEKFILDTSLAPHTNFYITAGDLEYIDVTFSRDTLPGNKCNSHIYHVYDHEGTPTIIKYKDGKCHVYQE